MYVFNYVYITKSNIAPGSTTAEDKSYFSSEG